jgi:hypothetical protein
LTLVGSAYGVQPMEDVATLAALAGVLLPRLRRWTRESWTVEVGDGTRGDVTAAVVQRLADLGADAEGQPRRTVPRLADISLADQLTVMVDDLLRTADPAALHAATAELTSLRATLDLR